MDLFVVNEDRSFEGWKGFVIDIVMLVWENEKLSEIIDYL